MKPETLYVYELHDPAKPEKIRYVGLTNCPKDRLRHHIEEAIAGKRSRRCQWIRRVLAQGRKPAMSLLVETDDAEAAADEERRIIAMLKEGKWSILNVHPGGGRGGMLGRRGARIDLTGRRFGRLLILGPAESRVHAGGQRRMRWRCRCDCGIECEGQASSIVTGQKKSCGCASGEARRVGGMIGLRFGRLVVVREVPPQRGPTRWICRCDCGRVKEVAGKNLRNGHVSSCGCARGGRNRIEMLGRRFGRLVVIGEAQKQGRWRRWTCRCDCGRTKGVAGEPLRDGRTVSCGCLGRERLVAATLARTGRGASGVAGVQRCGKRWLVRLSIAGVQVCFGTFGTVEEAATAVVAARAKPSHA